jgi:hypothetical protein
VMHAIFAAINSAGGGYGHSIIWPNVNSIFPGVLMSS